MHKKHNKHSKHDKSQADRIHKHAKENNENLSKINDIAKSKAEDSKWEKHLRLKVRYNEDLPHVIDHDIVRKRKRNRESAEKHQHFSPEKSHDRKSKPRQDTKNIGSIKNYDKDMRKVEFQDVSNKKASSCSLTLPKSKKKSLRKEKTIHIEKDIHKINMVTKDEIKRHHRTEPTKDGKAAHQQVMYCQIQAQPSLNQDCVYPGKFYGDRRKRKHWPSKERPQKEEKRDGENMLEKKKRKSKMRRHHNEPEDDKKIKELFVHTDKRGDRVKHKKEHSAFEPVEEHQKVNEEIIKSYFTKIQSMIDKKLEALLSSSKSKHKISNRDKSGEEKHRQGPRPKSQNRHRERPEALKVSRNSLSDSSVQIRKIKLKHREGSNEKRSSRRASKSQERVSGHRRDQNENNFRVQGIEPAEPLQQQGSAPRRKPCRNLECKTVSIIGIPSKIQDRSIVLNHTQTSTSLKFLNSDDEMVEKKKKTKRFKLYYKYSLDRNACVCDDSSDRHSLLSDSCRVLSVPSEESNLHHQQSGRHPSPVRTETSRRRDFVRFARDIPEKLPKRRHVKDTGAKLHNIVEERTCMSGEYNGQRLHCDYLNQIHSSNSEYCLKFDRNEYDVVRRGDYKENDYYRRLLYNNAPKSNNGNRKKRNNKFVSKSDVNISYDSLYQNDRERHKESRKPERPDKPNRYNRKSDGENVSDRTHQTILKNLKEFSKEYKERTYQKLLTGSVLQSKLFDIVGLADSVKYLPELENLRNLFQRTTNCEKVIAVGKDNMTQTSLSLSVGIEAEKIPEVKLNRTTNLSSEIKKDNRIKTRIELEETPARTVKETSDYVCRLKDIATNANVNKIPKDIVDMSTETDINRMHNTRVIQKSQQKFVEETKKENELKRTLRQQKKPTEKKAVIYRYKKHGKIPRFSRDVVTETRPKEAKMAKTYQCVGLNTSYDKVDQKCIGLNTSFVDTQQRSSIDESDKSIRLSKSDTSLRNRQEREPGDSTVASLTCLHRANDDKFTLSTKSNTQSLDHYGSRFIGDHPRTSRLFLTKDYKKVEIPAYQKRKSYDETIRKKLKKKSQSNRQFAQQIFEVRFLQVDKLPKLKEPSIQKLDQACSPINLHLKDSSQLFPRCFERALVRSLREEFINQKIPYKLDIARHKPNSGLSFSTTDNPSGNVNLRDKPKCETIVSIIDLTSETATNEGQCSINDSSIVDSDNFEKDSNIQDTTMRNLMNRNLSCPIFNHIDSSFDFLYETDSSSKVNTTTKRPTILGFALRSDTALTKVVTKRSYQRFDQVSNGEPSSEESGYSSRKSCESFFKQPFIAALLKPPSEMCLHPRGYDIYNAMSQKCQEFAHKVRVHSVSKTNLAETYEEMPLNLLISHQESTDSNNIVTPCDETRSIPSALSDESTNSDLSLQTGDLETNSSEILREILEGKLTFSSTDLNNFQIGCVNSTADQNNVLSLRKSKSNFCLVENSHKLKKIMVKNFFENLLEVYEKEIATCATLYEDKDFINSLIDTSRKKDLCNNGKASRGRVRRFIMTIFCMNNIKKTEVDCYAKTGRFVEQPEIVQEDHQKMLQALAHYTRKYFSMYEQAVKINQDINDEMKTSGFLKLLERIEAGQFTFLRRKDEVCFEEEIRSQVEESFENVLDISHAAARKTSRKLTSLEVKLICTYVIKYRFGLISTRDIIGSSIGSGLVKTEDQMKGAITYLLSLSNSKVDLVEFENVCRSIKYNS